MLSFGQTAFLIRMSHVTAVPLHSGQQYSVKQQTPILTNVHLALIDFMQTPKGIRNNNKIVNTDEYKNEC